jgi:hypothetical protein
LGCNGLSSGQFLTRTRLSLLGKKKPYLNHGVDSAPKLAWSTNENTFYILSEREISKVTVEDEGGLLQFSVERRSASSPQPDVAVMLVEHFGFPGLAGDFDTNDWEEAGLTFFREGDRSMRIEQGLGNSLRAGSRGERMTIADNPGIFHFGRRAFLEAAFLPNPEEFVFCDEKYVCLGSASNALG